jgi:hypothetical protein
MFINRFVVEPAGPKCAHYAPTLRPLSPQTVLELNLWAQKGAHYAPTMRHYAPTMFLNRFPVEPVGP